jgi:hypothetical protein
MRRITLVWRLFLILEVIALVASLSAGYFRSELGPFLWGVGFVLLLPGSILAGPLVEHALWMTRASLTAIGVAEILLSIAVNALVLWVGIVVIRQLRRRVAL